MQHFVASLFADRKSNNKERSDENYCYASSLCSSILANFFKITGTKLIVSTVGGAITLLSSDGNVAWRRETGLRSLTWPVLLGDINSDGTVEVIAVGYVEEDKKRGIGVYVLQADTGGNFADYPVFVSEESERGGGGFGSFGGIGPRAILVNLHENQVRRDD